MSGILSLDNVVGPRSERELQGYQVLPHLLTVALAHVCGELTVAPNSQHKWCSAVSLSGHASGTVLVPV